MLGNTRISGIAGIILAAAILAAATGVTFAAWIDNDAGIFRAMIDAGLSWCF